MRHQQFRLIAVTPSKIVDLRTGYLDITFFARHSERGYEPLGQVRTITGPYGIDVGWKVVN